MHSMLLAVYHPSMSILAKMGAVGRKCIDRGQMKTIIYLLVLSHFHFVYTVYKQLGYTKTEANAAEVSMCMAVSQVKELPGYSQRGKVGGVIFMNWLFSNCFSSIILVGDHRCQA